MIVSDDNVSTALKYLAEDPHPVAVARKRVTDAENAAKSTYGRLFLASNGSSVAAKEASVNSNQEYAAAKAEESTAIFELERHKARSRAADMLIEVWRSENANARAAERVR